MDKMTIAYGSEILLYISRYKKDPTDSTMGVNACIVEPLNMVRGVRAYLREI